jgi:hypothetical protein
VRRVIAALGAALTAIALLLTACSSNHPQGPTGRVVAKDADHECDTTWTGTGKKRHSHQSCHWEYDLTTRDKQGNDHEFDVSSVVYDSCRRGSSYPSCIHR